jgi:cytochrome c oxidase cbb3-type subunit III
MKCSQSSKVLVFSALLLAGVPGFGQSGAPGADLYAQGCAVCHGAEGNGSDRGTPIATEPSVIAMSDADLRGVLHNGAPGGMPAFSQLTDQQAQALVLYIRQLQGITSGASAVPTGDANAGKALFFGKAQCSTCHMIGGQGGFMAPDMTVYGKNRNAAAILQAIENPDKHLSPTSEVAEVVTTAGERISGVVRAEDDLQLTLQTVDGRYHFLNRANLAKVTYTDHSLMPHDYGKRLTAKELNDLVTYLIVTGKSTPAVAGSTRVAHDPYED